MGNELEILQDEAYKQVLNRLKVSNDPEDIQKLASAAASMDKGRNERDKITSDYVLSESKITKDQELAERKLEEEREDRRKQIKFDRIKGCCDIGLKLIAVIGTGVLGYLAYREEDEGYPKHPKTVQGAKDLMNKVIKF